MDWSFGPTALLHLQQFYASFTAGRNVSSGIGEEREKDRRSIKCFHDARYRQERAMARPASQSHRTSRSKRKKKKDIFKKLFFSSPNAVGTRMCLIKTLCCFIRKITLGARPLISHLFAAAHHLRCCALRLDAHPPPPPQANNASLDPDSEAFTPSSNPLLAG